MITDNLQNVVKTNQGVGGLFLRNLLKESLQLYTLNFIYTSTYAENFLFKGGTCLRFCFDLPRLSEDLDFDIKNFSQFSLKDFTNDLQNYFVKKLQYKDLALKIAGNNRQIFLKFPIMNRLGLTSNISESNILFLRLDLSAIDSSIFTEKMSLKSSYDFNFFIKRYSLPDLFASKIAAILQRSFQKGKNGQVNFKGRDYFDLIWFLEKQVKPNRQRLQDIVKTKNWKKIINNLDQKVESISKKHLREDLLPLFKDTAFVHDFAANFQQLYKTHHNLLT